MSELINLIGLKFNRLTVLSRVANKPKSDTSWRCKCDCGKFIIAKSYRLRKGITKSCGCLTKEKQKQKNTTHGMSNDKLYYKWHDLKTRHKEWLSPIWLDAPTFINWSLANGYREGLSLIRINKLFGYAPGNCKWVDKATYNKDPILSDKEIKQRLNQLEAERKQAKVERKKEKQTNQDNQVCFKWEV